MFRKIIKYSIVLAVFALVFAAYIVFFKPHANAGVTVVIPKGASIQRIASILYQADVIENPNLFRLAAKLSGYETKLQAGKFKLPQRLNNLDVLRLLNTGRQIEESVTLPEGSTAKQIAAVLSAKVEIDSAAFMELVFDSAFTAQKNVPASNLEGYLFPETYRMYWGIAPEEAAGILVEQFFHQLPKDAEEKAAALGYTLHEMITLASIIEGEAILPEEHAIIAGVYYNRLRKGIRLQADPTIQYIIPDGPRRLLNKDLQIDSPYNTYKYAGLPPGPIKNPGHAAIVAALNPADVPYLYFVAKGDGSHVFSATLNQHLRAKKEFDKVRRRVAREKKKGNGN
ncbi:MAG: endolytic transglycosylase MltG [Deferribacteres bacterium]|nr:endolytic transglycosylase MltG [candidate division KSB1 bacterium]MCB9503685.1 endolytic transglycosylase MltG [Deferribacteres bacterium]